MAFRSPVLWSGSASSMIDVSLFSWLEIVSVVGIEIPRSATPVLQDSLGQKSGFDNYIIKRGQNSLTRILSVFVSFSLSLPLCSFIWTCVGGCGCLHVLVFVGIRSQCWKSSLITSHCTWGSVSHWAQCSLTRLGWLANEIWWTAWFQLYLLDLRLHAWLFIWAREPQLGFQCLCGKHLTIWGMFPVPEKYTFAFLIHWEVLKLPISKRKGSN